MTATPIFPFAAIVGQDDMKLALILNIINPKLSGVLIRGEKGTGKSTAVRALAEILPEIEVLENSPYSLSPQEVLDPAWRDSIGLPEKPAFIKRRVRVVELPVGATEDRVVGTMDLEQALKCGEKQFEPGLLAAAHRGILYVDEVNLLDDHVVDVLLDAAAMGVNTVAREGVGFTHPAGFTLVGTMNPEEGELRPQLLDRFGLCVHIEGIRDTDSRIEVMERRLAYEENPLGFLDDWKSESEEIALGIQKARDLLPRVTTERPVLARIAEICLEAGVDGHRADIITLKTAKTLAAWKGREEVNSQDVDQALELALPHRVRRRPFEDVARDAAAIRGV